MLSALRIANFAILDAAELALGPGLIAITGETGAGKSILVDALAVVLGGRASERAIRHGADQSEIEAQFDDVRDPAVQATLAELGIDGSDGTVVLRRIVARNGKSRCLVNGRLVTVQQLRAIAAPLCDLSSQHAQHRLLDRAVHLDVLDRYAGHGKLRETYELCYKNWRSARSELQALQKEAEARSDRLDYLRFVRDELAALQLKPGEFEEIQQGLQRMRASEQLTRAVAEAEQSLGGDGGARDLAGKATRSLSRLQGLDDKLVALAERAAELQMLATELANDLGSYARTLGRDERQQARLAERLDQIHKAFRKYGGTEAAVIDKYRSVQAELDIEASELRVAELHNQLAKQDKQLRELADELSERRLLAASPLSTQVTAVVRELGMPAANFRAVVRRVPALQAALPGSTGWDEVVFELCANKGESGGPLAEVASGGELSRVLLAVQRAVSDAAVAHETLRQDQTPPLATCIYDEADAGLSGSTGLVLGRFLAEVGARQQVLCISHLPQVAAAADWHVQVAKAEVDGRTCSRLELLDEQGRIAELARMLGTVPGQGDTALAHARQLRSQQARA